MESTQNKRKRNEHLVPTSSIAARVGDRNKKPIIRYNVTRCNAIDSCFPMKRDKKENLISCNGDYCDKIHLHQDSWEWNKCQSCVLCKKGMLNDKLLKCYKCFLHYHTKCHGVEDTMKIIRENRFLSITCKPAKGMSTSSRVTRKSTQALAQRRVKPPTGSDSKSSGDGKSGYLAFNSDEVAKLSSLEDESHDPNQLNVQRVQQLPAQNRFSQQPPIGDDDVSGTDASDWTEDQVFKYFKNIFPQHAQVFKDHEIDGTSLSMLKLEDIINHFGIKVGPALKIYGHILTLQTKNDDPTLTSHYSRKADKL